MSVTAASPTVRGITITMRRDSARIIAEAGQAKVREAIDALRRWRRRQDRAEHPDGEFDSAKRWYPTRAENVDRFTSYTRSPSHAWPYSYMLAARSLSHCEALDGADHDVVLALRRVGIDGTDDQVQKATVLARRAVRCATRWLEKHPGRTKKVAARRG
jgi:hypothetical protein